MSSTSLKYWPVHFPPFQNESLYSWLNRIAIAHGLPVRSLVNLACKKPIQATDYDLILNYSQLDKIACLAGLSAQTLYSSSLNGVSCCIEPKKSKARPRWLISEAQSNKGRGKPITPICPICLQEDSTPYLRTEWRLPFYTFCQKHDVLLLDCCNNCGTPLNVHKDLFLEFKPLPSRIECPQCGVCLEEVTLIRPYGGRIASVYEIAKNNRRVDVDYASVAHFYSTLYVLLENIAGQFANEDLVVRTSKYLKNCHFELPSEVFTSRKEFSSRSVIVRHNALLLCELILAKTPWAILRRYAQRTFNRKPAERTARHFVHAVAGWVSGAVMSFMPRRVHPDEFFNLSYIQRYRVDILVGGQPVVDIERLECPSSVHKD